MATIKMIRAVSKKKKKEGPGPFDSRALVCPSADHPCKDGGSLLWERHGCLAADHPIGPAAGLNGPENSAEEQTGEQTLGTH